jgi:hypothetical protein
MSRGKRYAVLTALASAALAGGILTAATAGPTEHPVLTNVATANTRSDGYAPWSKLSVELRQVVVAQGSTKLDGGSASPSSVGYYGYDNDLLNAAGQPQMIPTSTSAGKEAHKTEPDKNTYLRFKDSLTGADPGYYYGQNFLFQGHESGSPGYITRINLDADADHRVTLLATKDVTGANLATIDGITWEPWAKRLLLTTENANAPTYAATPDYPSAVTDVSGALGRGGYEGIQDDNDGNIWIAEDVGGSSKPGTTARIPNSFIYRYVPKTKGDLANGKLQVLQVLNAAGNPITKASQTTPVNSPDQVALHTYGASFQTNWVTIHDTAVDGTAPFAANPLAVAKNGTPFKRPENGAFRPQSGFKDFYFDETGDTNATSPENANGGWTSVFKLRQKDPSADSGTLTLFYKGDGVRAGFDNVTFISRNQITFVEDAGAGLHGSRNVLDSGWVLNVNTNYADPSNQPIRWLAQGRDPSATLDASLVGTVGFTNDDDNEITGVLVSDGDPGPGGILGAKPPQPFKGHWRWFYTQQHGDNATYEVIPAEGDGPPGP